MIIRDLASAILSQGEIVRQPVGSGNGYWVGAPGCFHDSKSGESHLAYRIRRPRGVEPDRGAELHIARSTDGIHFDDMRTIFKSEFRSTSIERCMPWRGEDGQWWLFMSYVDPADGRWCTSVLKGPSIEKLDSIKVRRIFTAGQLGLEGVKDPWIMQHQGTFYMFLSVATATAATGAKSHSTHDIYNTGQCVSATALATSRDLDNWQWHGVIFKPEKSGWDGYCRRINSVVPAGKNFLAFYDGSASHLENYEEKTGLAISDNLKTWRTLTPDGPGITSLHASRSLRYIDAQSIESRVRIYYEAARPDGSHELRVAQVDPAILGSIE